MDGDSAGSERRASPSLRLAAPRPVLAAAHLQLLASVSPSARRPPRPPSVAPLESHRRSARPALAHLSPAVSRSCLGASPRVYKSDCGRTGDEMRGGRRAFA